MFPLQEAVLGRARLLKRLISAVVILTLSVHGSLTFDPVWRELTVDGVLSFVRGLLAPILIF